ncbi:MAG TPA: DUF4133 domain-containing protein [Puia sp.]|nr:DUF4133 domain-containing protein [Puia sp.]
MKSKEFTINKGVNRPLMFRGLKAQYVTYLAFGMLGLLLAFVILHLAGLPTYFCVVTILGAGVLLINRVYTFSRKWGQYGLQKRQAARRLPTAIRSRTRRIFITGQ